MRIAMCAQSKSTLPARSTFLFSTGVPRRIRKTTQRKTTPAR
jgi:hypothetical protein